MDKKENLQINKQASSADRHQAVVKGQENLTGIKEVRIKRVLKENTENEVVVSQSTRYEMLYDTVEEAKRAYENIIDAQEEAEFDGRDQKLEEKEENMKFDKDAGLSFGMKVKGCYVGTYDPMTDSYEVHNTQASTRINKDLLKLAASNKNIGICVHCGAIYPMVDTGIGGISTQAPKDPVDFNKGGPEQAYGYCAFCGKSTSPEVEQPNTFMPDTFGRGEAHIPNPVKESAEIPNTYPSLLESGFNVSPTEYELKLGIEREHEHTDDPAKALEIAVDHIAEDNNYYTKLNKVMPESGKEHKPKRDVTIKEDKTDKETDENISVDSIINHEVEAVAKTFLSKAADSLEDARKVLDPNKFDSITSVDEAKQLAEEMIRTVYPWADMHIARLNKKSSVKDIKSFIMELQAANLDD